jgi:hypothetical protein
MSKVEQKTKPSGENVAQFLNEISDDKRRQDCFTLLELMGEITQTEPKIWASSMIGFGDYHYKYASGHEGDWFLIGFAPRKQNLTMYILSGFEQQEHLLEKLGKYKAGKGCLYIKDLEDIHLPTLRELIRRSFEHKLEIHTY